MTYIDDIMIHSPSEDGMLRLFEEVLQRLKKAGAKMKMEKVRIAPERIKYLGHMIEGGRRYPDAKRVASLGKIKKPTSIKEVRSLVGVLNWFRHYVPGYSALIRPLTRLLSPKNHFLWTDDCQKALEKASEILQTATLSIPLVGGGFRLETDASDVAIGRGIIFERSLRRRSSCAADHVLIQDVD